VGNSFILIDPRNRVKLIDHPEKWILSPETDLPCYNQRTMNTRIYHGQITTRKLAHALLAKFNRGNLIAQQIGTGDHIVIQISTKKKPTIGGRTALTVTMQTHEDGVSVQMGKQSWLGIAASLGKTALKVWKKPKSVIGRLDDLAQDIEYLQLSEDVWDRIEETVRLAGASHEMSERLRRLTCDFCLTANPVGEPSCVACGAPLGEVQPYTCSNCGFVVTRKQSKCPNCGTKLP
jgi:hypothetical protein